MGGQKFWSTANVSCSVLQERQSVYVILNSEINLMFSILYSEVMWKSYRIFDIPFVYEPLTQFM